MGGVRVAAKAKVYLEVILLFLARMMGLFLFKKI